jgi:lysophospholipase L1-like esterase
VEDVMAASTTRDRFVYVKDGLSQPHPYILYTNRPGFADKDAVQINSLGYRGRDIAREKPAGTYRVLALGGSTTLSWPFIEDAKRTWTARVEAGLARRYPDRTFEVVNAGQAYATSAELLAGYVFRHRYLRPDLVIVHEGGNDVSPVLFENYNPEYTHFRAAGIKLFVGRVEHVLLRSNVMKVFYAYYWRGVPSIYVPQPYDFDLIPRDVALKRVNDTHPIGFQRNLDLLVRTALADGAQVLLVGFVQAREEFLARNRPDLAGLEKALATGVEKNHRVMEAIAAKYDVPFLRPPAGAFKDEWFLDTCHLNQEGEDAKAAWILEGVTRLIAPQ